MTLSEFLSANDITDAAFGVRIGRDRSTVGRIKRGETKPDWDTLQAILSATNGAVTPNDFIDLPEAANG